MALRGQTLSLCWELRGRLKVRDLDMQWSGLDEAEKTHFKWILACDTAVMDTAFESACALDMECTFTIVFCLLGTSELSF